MVKIVQVFDYTKGSFLVYSYFQTYISQLYLYIVSQTSGTGNASNTTQDTNTSSVQGIISVCIYTCN